MKCDYILILSISKLVIKIMLNSIVFVTILSDYWVMTIVPYEICCCKYDILCHIGVSVNRIELRGMNVGFTEKAIF